MKLTLSTQPSARLKTPLAVVILDWQLELADAGDTAVGRVLADARRRYNDRVLKTELFHTFEDGAVRHLLVFSTSLYRNFNVWETVKICAARAAEHARSHGLGGPTVLLNGEDGGPFVGKVVEGLLLGDYRFNAYKKQKPRPALAGSIVVRPTERKAAAERLRRYDVVCRQVNRCRDVVNEPGAAVTPQALARLARKIAAEGKLSCTILNESQLKKQGYHGLLTVSQASDHPPRLIVLGYRPARRSRDHLALVGKGVTFDTGGLSLKRAEGMWTMKADMAGGAAVLLAMAAIAARKPDVRVTGIVAAAENVVGARAVRPGDIFIARNGKSVMVDNTDAEGRLVLTDGLARAGEEKATHIVDIATLTGAVVRALGPGVEGIMGNDAGLVQAVIQSGEHHGERFWELPLVEEYRELLNTYCADLKNVGGNPGAITAGLFLREFVPEGVAWAHLDIAGPGFIEKRWKHYTEGATGFGVKTLVELAERFGTPF